VCSAGVVSSLPSLEVDDEEVHDMSDDHAEAGDCRRVQGHAKRIVAPMDDPDTPRSKIEKLDKETERFQYIPPAAREIVEEREKEQHKEL
jgi:hypothetical protein